MKRWFIFLIVLSLALGACSSLAGATNSSVPAATTVAQSPTSAEIVLAEKATAPTSIIQSTPPQSERAQITFVDGAINVNGDGVQVDANHVTIVAGGVYRLQGVLADGQVLVQTDESQIVWLIFDGVTLQNSSGSPLVLAKAQQVYLVLADGSQNFVSDAVNYTFPDAQTDEPNAAIFSKVNLSISGSGALTVTGNYNDAIVSKDALLIEGGNLAIAAADDGIRGKDSLIILGGTLNVTAQGDGLRADEDSDPAKGYLLIESGSFTVTAGGDALSAQTDAIVRGGTLTLTSGGGSTQLVDESSSAKGIKAGKNLMIEAGSLTVNSADDALHSNTHFVLNNGTLTLASGDDGIHADSTLMLNGGDVTITQSYEGIESAVITLNGSSLTLNARDDGINVAGGIDGSGFAPGGRHPGGGGGMPADTFNADSPYFLYIHGGTVLVNASGDGIDVNGAFEMTGGEVWVSGPTEQMNGALDYDAGFKLTGGFLIAAGSSGMVQSVGSVSTQNSLTVFFTSVQPAGTTFALQREDGETLVIYTPEKAYQSVVFSSPDLQNGQTYIILLSGSEYQRFTVSQTLTTIGTGGGGMRPARP